MKVILKKDVNHLGYTGDVVEVSRGYARNYLFPRDFATEHTPGNLKSVEHLKQKAWEKRNREISEAKQLAEKINSITLVFTKKTGKDGKLFGSVTHKDISESLVENHQIEIDRKKIEEGEPLKKIGSYKVNVHLHKDVNATLHVQVNAEEEPKTEADSAEKDPEKAE